MEMRGITLFLLLASLILLYVVPIYASDELSLPKGLQGISISGEYYLGFKSGEKGGTEFSIFEIRRGYLTVNKKIIPGLLSSRITLDTSQDEDGDGEGDMEARIKYAYAQLLLPDFSFVNKAKIEFGIVHTPWLDYEQGINAYRMRDKMFMERSGIVNSGDFGVTVFGLFGGKMDDSYKKRVSKKYAGRYGSFAFGIYNGGGYHAVENNKNKAAELRVSIRPLPDILSGLQISYFGTNGEGNKAGEADETPDWIINSVMLSYQAESYTLTGQFLDGKGNQKGSWYDSNDMSIANEYQGYSVFGEKRLKNSSLIMGGFDSFDPNKDIDNNEYIRYYVGLGYDFGKRNILLFDYNVKSYEDSSKSDDFWFQLTMQVKF